VKRLYTLLVDDDSYSRDLLGSILRDLNCTTDHASSGMDAISKCKASQVDLLFLDIEMPGISGFETLEKILENTPDQYAIMISAHSTLDNVKKAIELGAMGFVVKPFTVTKVRDLLEKYRKDRSPPA
jgi:two-component system chemotaxis response regulator CheY